MSLNQLILLPLIDDLGLFIANVFAIISHFLLHVHHVIYLQSLYQCEHLTQAVFLVIHHKTEIPDCLQRTKNMFPNFFSNLQKYLVITNPTLIETEHRTRLFYLARSAQTWQRDGSIKCGICWDNAPSKLAPGTVTATIHLPQHGALGKQFKFLVISIWGWLR